MLKGTQYICAQRARRLLPKAFSRAVEKYDVILGSTIPIKTPKFDKENWVTQAIDVIEKVKPFTVPANLTGFQFFGKNFSEHELLKVAKAWESTEPISYDPIKL